MKTGDFLLKSERPSCDMVANEDHFILSRLLIWFHAGPLVFYCVGAGDAPIMRVKMYRSAHGQLSLDSASLREPSAKPVTTPVTWTSPWLLLALVGDTCKRRRPESCESE